MWGPLHHSEWIGGDLNQFEPFSQNFTNPMLTMEPTACNIFRKSIDKIYYLDSHEESACGDLSITQNGLAEI
jgi:hypothetical protein